MIQTSKYYHFPASLPTVWLVDNGSLRAESVLALREQAARLAQISGVAVQAVSVLHSSKVPAEELGGQAAVTFTQQLRAGAQAGLQRLLVLPYFFGPSAALTDYLPQQIARVRQEFPQLEVRIAPPLVDLGDAADGSVDTLAAALAQGVEAFLPAADGGTAAQADASAAAPVGDGRKHTNEAEPVGNGQAGADAVVTPCAQAVAQNSGQPEPAVVLVDHGSPQRGVSAVRDRVGEALHGRLCGRVRAFGVCSMEAREGPEYAHTLPLLEQVLEQEPFRCGKVIVAPLFLSPGRHAGEGGDLWQIAERGRAAHPALDVVFCPLIGGGPAVTAILLKRLRAGLAEFR